MCKYYCVKKYLIVENIELGFGIGCLVIFIMYYFF